MNVGAQWKLFVRELARMHDDRCFPSALSTQFVRSAIAKRIPLPADEVPTFMYSDQGERFVNLGPDMEIRIQTVLSKGMSGNAETGNSLRLLTVVYDVVSDHGDGIRLKPNRGLESGHETSLETSDRQFMTLDKRFAHTSVLRLWLQGFLNGGSESNAVLLGTSNPMQLDRLTDLIRQRNPSACPGSEGSVCIDFPPSAVSLFSIIWINGRRTASPFGTSLAALLNLLPPSNQAKALESVQITRRLSSDRYADIHFRRTVDGATQLLLLPGDKIDWKE